MLIQDKHRAEMYRLLIGILHDSFLATVLGFKGGTACYFFHALPRFSVDLDFDIISKTDSETESKEIFERIKTIITNSGLVIRDERLKRNTVFFLVSYEGPAHNIKIEISRRDYSSQYETLDFYGLPVKVMVKPDMFAHKLVAATERKKTASRDFFDIWYFFDQNWPINKEMVRLRTGKDLGAYLGDLQRTVQTFLTSRTILQGIGELVDEKQKVWIKNKLKNELLGIIQFRLDQMKRDEPL